NQNIHLLNGQGNALDLTITYAGEDKTISALPASELANNTSYTFQIGALKSTNGAEFGGENFSFSTGQARLNLELITIDDQNLIGSDRILNVKRNFLISAKLSHPLNSDT